MAATPRASVDAAPDLAELSTRRRDDPLLDCLAVLTRLHGRPVSAEALAAGLPIGEHGMTPALFVRAAQRQGFAARVLRRPLARISNLVLPAVLVLEKGRACVLTRLERRRSARVILPESGAGETTVALKDLKRDYAGYCIFAQPEPRPDTRTGEAADLPSGRFWFWGTLWRFRRYYGEAIVATCLVNVLAVATALFIMNVYDRVVPNNATETLVVLATGTAIAIGFEFLARNLRAYFLEVSGKKADLLLASRLFQQALALRMDVRPGSAGAFAAQLREFEALRDFCSSATLTVVADLPFVFFFIWVVSLIGGPLYQVPLLAVPLVVGVGLLAQIPLAWLMRRNLRESALRHGLLVEAIEGTEALKALNAEGVMQRRWEDYNALTGRSSARARTVSGLVVHFATLATQVVTVLVVVWGVHLIGEGTISVGALIAAVILSGRAMAPLGQVAGLLARYQHARAAYFTLNELMRRPVERPRGRSFLHRERIEGAIELGDVQFTYPGSRVPALRGVSASIGAGEHVAVLGRVGSGKSTLLRLLMGFYRPAQGSILLDGTDLEQYDPVDLRRNVAYVAQDVRLFHGTLRENVTLGAPWADDASVLRVARLAGLDQMVARHPDGFDMVLAEGGGGLSGGQRQAVALARALLLAPPVLLLDEPTSAMDSNAEQAFIRELGAFAKGRTLLLVTHKPTMLALVDRVIVLDGGRAVADGPRDRVLQALTRPLGDGGGPRAGGG